jgi:GNAT superfamily N-acetyltransferase
MDLGDEMKQYTRLAPEQKLVLTVTDTMREVTHRRPEREDDEYFEEGEQDVEYVPTVLAHVDGQLAGALWMQRGEAYAEHEWEVAKVEVYGEHRRKGLATVLWAAAQREYSLGHSGFLTEDGEGWSQYVDGVVGEDGLIHLPEQDVEWDAAVSTEGDLAADQVTGRPQMSDEREAAQAYDGDAFSGHDRSRGL